MPCSLHLLCVYKANLMNRIFSLLLAFLVSYNLAQAQIAPVYQGMFQHVLDSVCTKYNIKGVSASILVPEMGIWNGVYGESHAGSPITPDMYLPIGSNTKTFTSIILLKMQEQGILDLDDTIGTWLQGIPNVKGQITIRQMLNHTSGLYNYTNHNDFFVALNADYTHVFQPEDMLQYIDTPDFVPGAKWEYSNTGYLLAGLIIKKIRNEPFHVTVRDMILTPYQLSNTLTYPGEKPQKPEPHGWYTNSSGVMTDMQVSYGWTNNAFLSMASSAGAIMSTAEDNVKFWDALLTGKILNATSMTEMKTFTSMSLGPYTGYGLGLAKGASNGRTIMAHRGTCFGYLNENLVDATNGVCITVLSNYDSPGNDWLYVNLVRPLHALTIKLPPASVETVFETGNVKIYPNPASNVVNVDIEQDVKNGKMQLYDMTGKLLMEQQLSGKHTPVNTENYHTGLYLLKLQDDNGRVYTQKLQIAK
jgi:D-alanyl-D-alanine carboxypeptidase